MTTRWLVLKSDWTKQFGFSISVSDAIFTPEVKFASDTEILKPNWFVHIQILEPMLHSGLPKIYFSFFHYFYYIYRYILDLMPINTYIFSAKNILWP